MAIFITRQSADACMSLICIVGNSAWNLISVDGLADFDKITKFHHTRSLILQLYVHEH